jgi:hypothetical protein
VLLLGWPFGIMGCKCSGRALHVTPGCFGASVFYLCTAGLATLELRNIIAKY